MRLPLPKTIQARLILSHMLVSLISIALISGFAGRALYIGVHSQAEQELRDLALSASNDIEHHFLDYLSAGKSAADVQTSLDARFSGSQITHYTVYLPDGQPVIDSRGALPSIATRENNPEFWKAIEAGIGESEPSRLNWFGDEIVRLAVRIEHNQQLAGILHIEASISLLLLAANSTLGILIVITLLLALGMSLLGFFLARSLAEPLEKMTRTAESLAMGEMDARVQPPKAPYELRRLAEAFNSMAAQIQGHLNELRGFVANASHELRTPLTSIKLRVEALQEGALEDPSVSVKFLEEIESEVDRLSKMVNDLLDLSRIEAGLEARRLATIDLEMVAKDVQEAFQARSERAGIRLTSRLETRLPPINGNEDQIRRMLYNLVDNALKYTPHGGQVEILLRRGDATDTLLLSVKDSGFGIAAAQLPHIFERFYRVEATRPRYGHSQGSGLGLPIAKSIAEIHGGRIGVASQVGSGSTFWVELPIQKSQVEKSLSAQK
jgi:signal transduction histidine kinase